MNAAAVYILLTQNKKEEETTSQVKMNAAALTYRHRIALDLLAVFITVSTFFLILLAEELHGKIDPAFFLPSVHGILVAGAVLVALVTLILALPAVISLFSSKLEGEELVYILTQNKKEEEILTKNMDIEEKMMVEEEEEEKDITVNHYHHHSINEKEEVGAAAQPGGKRLLGRGADGKWTYSGLEEEEGTVVGWMEI